MRLTCFVCGTDIRLEKSVSGRCLKCEGKAIYANIDRIYRSFIGPNFISDRR